MKKTYKVDLLPEDFANQGFNNSSDCALARATKRKFKARGVTCCESYTDVYFDKEPYHLCLKVPDLFAYSDWKYVKEQYQDPNHDTIYYVTLKEI